MKKNIIATKGSALLVSGMWSSLGNEWDNRQRQRAGLQ